MTAGARTVRAVVLRAPGTAPEVREVRLDPPGRGEVLVRIRAAGVCHSDLSIVDGVVGSPMPAVLGHEAAGVVEEVGEGVTRVAPGARVIVSWVAVCRRCRDCLEGRPQLCLSGTGRSGLMDDGRSRLSLDGEMLHHGVNAAVFAEAAVLRETAVVAIPDDVAFHVAAVVGCAVTTGVGAALNTAEVRPGEQAVVIGCGGVGLSTVQGCRLAGAGRIVAVDPVASRREAALRFGATDALDPGDGDGALVKEIKRLTGGGADVAFEVVGRPALQRLAFDVTRRGGRTILVGVPPHGSEVTLPSMLLVIHERTVRGSFYGSADPERDFPRILDLHRTGRLDLEALVTRRLPLDGVNDAFEAMRRGAEIRTVLEP